MKSRKTTATSNGERQTSNLKSQTSNSSVVRLKKPHPCGGSEFTVVREGPVVTLRCATCGSFLRLAREKYDRYKIPP